MNRGSLDQTDMDIANFLINDMKNTRCQANEGISMTEMTYENIVATLRDAVPQFRPDVGDVHDSLVHVIFGDLMRFVKSLATANGQEELLQRIFDFVEAASRSDDVQVLNAVRDSFLEALAASPSTLEETQKYMGPSTRKRLREAKNYLNS
jgi:hypothetical protein